MTNYMVDKGYLAIKVQAVPTTPVTPGTFIPLISESIRLNPNIIADRRIKGLDWKSDDMLKGPRTVEGDLVVYADPDTLGHLLNMCYTKGASAGSAPVGFTHPFLPGEGKSYCIDIGRGITAQRIWGARIDNLKLEFQDNKLMATASIKALGQFNGASLAVALTGAGMTSAVLKQDYNAKPTEGLVAGDVITVGGVDLTLLTVAADGITVTFASTAVTAAIGDPLVLKAQTPSYTTIVEPLYMNNALVGVAATSALADTAAATKATATPCYDININLKQNLLDAPATGSAGPSVLMNQVKESQIELSRLFETPVQYHKWIETTKQGMTMIVKGRFIKSDNTTWEAFTIKFHNVKQETDEQPLDVGKYLFDKQKFEALYDVADAKSIEITLVNRTDATGNY
jgi:hypothetical protein